MNRDFKASARGCTVRLTQLCKTCSTVFSWRHRINGRVTCVHHGGRCKRILPPNVQRYSARFKAKGSTQKHSDFQTNFLQNIIWCRHKKKIYMFNGEILLLFILTDFNKISIHFSGCINHEMVIIVEMLIRHVTKHLQQSLWTHGQWVYSGTLEDFLVKKPSLLSNEHAVIHHTTGTNQTTREYSLYIIIIIILRADWGQEMRAIIRCRILCLLGCYPKI